MNSSTRIMPSALLTSALLTSLFLLWPDVGHAQSEDESADAPAESGEGEKSEEAVDGDADGEKGDAEKKEQEGADADVNAGSDAKNSPVEVTGKTYNFVGLRYRMIVIPKFMMNLFGDGAATAVNHAVGPEFVIRKDNFEYQLALWYAGYGLDSTPFKASSDPEVAWELVESQLKIIYFTVDFMWSKPITEQFAFNYGLGGGFGIVFGDLLRTQAYPDPNNAGEYLPCSGVGVPRGDYCAADNDHYPGYKEPSWFDGGSKPVMFPWFAGQFGFRFKPHRNFAARLDMGIGVGQFFVGLGAHYGL
jgi:hypothetical protein